MSSSALQIDSLKIVKIGQVGVQSIADAICEHALALRGGSLGWLDLSSIPATVGGKYTINPVHTHTYIHTYIHTHTHMHIMKIYFELAN